MIEKISKSEVWQRDSKKNNMIFPVKINKMFYSDNKEDVLLSRYYKDDLFEELEEVRLFLYAYIFPLDLGEELYQYLKNNNFNLRNERINISVYSNYSIDKIDKYKFLIEKFIDIYEVHNFDSLKGKLVVCHFIDKNYSSKFKLGSFFWKSYKTGEIFLSLRYKLPKNPNRPYFLINSKFVEFEKNDISLLIKLKEKLKLNNFRVYNNFI